MERKPGTQKPRSPKRHAQSDRTTGRKGRRDIPGKSRVPVYAAPKDDSRDDGKPLRKRASDSQVLLTMEKWAVKKTRCAAQSGKTDLVRTLILLYQTDQAKFSQEFARALQPDNRTPFGPTSPLYPFGTGGSNYLAVATTDGFCFRTTLKLLGLPAQQSIDSLPEHVTLALIERVAHELRIPVCYPSREKTWRGKTSIMISSQGDIKHCWLIVKQDEIRDYSTTFIDIASI